MADEAQPNQTDGDLLADPIQTHTTAQVRNNLPAQPTPLIGRTREIAAATALLRRADTRLLTLIGSGGAGKTRLGLQVAEVLQADFADGVVFVALAPVSDPSLVAAAIAQTLDIQESGGRSLGDLVQDWLREKRMLLLLDNFEQVLAGALFLATLLREAPNLKIIVTSRERLNLRGEQMFAVAGLSLPADDRADLAQATEYGALMLFTHIASALTPDFELTDAALPAVLRICRLLEGLPLGIELAAPWTRLLSCEEIAQEIAQNLDFLNTSAHDVSARHQSLRAVFMQSWEQLAPAEQHALRRLSIFRSSFTREAAATVCGELRIENEDLRNDSGAQSTKILNSQFSILNLLASLVDKSLVRSIASGGANTARYEIHEILRQYAAVQLDRAGEASATAERHAGYYLTLLEARTLDLRGPRQLDALAVIGAEIEQMRVAWRWAVARADIAAIGRAIDSLFHFYDMRSWFAEGADMFRAARRALEAGEPSDGGLVWARALAREGWFTFYLGRQAEARRLLEQSLDRLRSLDARAEMVFALNYLAAVCSYLGEHHRTDALCQESLAIAEALGDSYGQAVACNILGQSIYWRGDHATARQWFQRSLTLGQQLGNRWHLAFSLTYLGNGAYALGEYAEARNLFEQSLRIREETGDARGMAICFNQLGDAAVALREYDQAGERYSQALALFREIGNQWGRASALLNIGRLALMGGRDSDAARALQEALQLAIDTQSLPQALEVFSAFADLLRRNAEAAWANEVAELATAKPESLAAYRRHVDRLLAWSPPELTTPAAVDIGPASVNTTQRVAQTVYPAGLTAREVEVLRLVAQGLTDAQVAEQLILSRRTVSTHLTSIYGKLQITSRSAATRFAVENGLV
jgi:predicted ATPase/DNA-binding CsgD family transcriptional regulator